MPKVVAAVALIVLVNVALRLVDLPSADVSVPD
jgi:hypothetical protein